MPKCIGWISAFCLPHFLSAWTWRLLSIGSELLLVLEGTCHWTYFISPVSTWQRTLGTWNPMVFAGATQSVYKGSNIYFHLGLKGKLNRRTAKWVDKYSCAATPDWNRRNYYHGESFDRLSPRTSLEEDQKKRRKTTPEVIDTPMHTFTIFNICSLKTPVFGVAKPLPASWVWNHRSVGEVSFSLWPPVWVRLAAVECRFA